jgi:Xaa-Pro dipeptidase
LNLIKIGIYFIPSVLDVALQDPEKSKFLVAEKIQQFRNFGGVRLEDDVIVTKDGIENMTQIPRTVQEIEEWMAK